MRVYDKAKWHHDSAEFPSDLSNSQAFVHIGFVLAWLISRDLISELFSDDFQEDIERFRRRELTGPGLLEIADGALVQDMVTTQADDFLKDYYLDAADFWDDYESCFKISELDSVYHVRDTWENCDALAGVLDDRFTSWLEAKGG